MTDLQPVEPPVEDSDRKEARKHIEKRRGPQAGWVAYVVVNAFLIGIWWASGSGYFWPGWILAGWGMGMVLATFDYLRKPITEADVDRELRRMR
jgi:hypothetical protein